MKSLKNQQSKVKNQQNNPFCVLYAAASAIEEATIKSGNPVIIDADKLERDAETIHLEWKPGDAYGPGSIDKALTWAKGFIGGYQWVKKEEIKNWIDKGCSVIVSLAGYPLAGRDLYHTVLFTGYDEDGYEYKNSWGTSWQKEGYGYFLNQDLKYIAEPCYVVIPKTTQNQTETMQNKPKLLRPVDAPITQGYGENVAYYNTKALGYTLGHNAVDFGCPVGTPVKNAADGVLEANKTIAGALVMTVKHEFGTTEYWHLSRTVGLAGDKVKQGDIICWSGNSGKFVKGKGHLHFEFHPNTGGNPQMNGTVDPMPYFSAQLTESQIDAGLQLVLKAPIPPFNPQFGRGYPGGRVNWALTHRKNIY